MLDTKLLRTNPDEVAKQLARRGFPLDIAKLSELEEKRKHIQTQTQELQSQRNNFAKLIGQAKAAGQDVAPLLAESNKTGNQLQENEAALNSILAELNTLYLTIPNIPHTDVPDGKSEADNLEIRRWGEPTQFNFTAKDHVELGAPNNLIDFNASAKITGARFVVMRGGIARLHRALIQFMMDVHTKEHGYQEIYVPYLVNTESLYGTGQLPKFAEDLFAIKGEQNYHLISTGEIPVTNLARDEIIDGTQLPVKYVSHTPCFRSEAGSYGKDTKGMIRQHQFEKVELVQFVRPENSYEAHEQLTQHAEAILQKLGLPYRVVILCTADIGFTAAKTYDLEVWLPGQQKYRNFFLQ
jgi:seryl-tRNA synthetase